MAFDPDAYLAAKPGGFDPDAYLGAKAAPAPRQVSMPEAVERGVLQGASLGFADELAAAIDTGLSKIPGVRDVAQRLNGMSGGSGAGLPVDDPSIGYQQRRDAYRGLNADAQAQHPRAYGAGEIGGGLVTGAALPVLPGGAIASAAKTGALIGGAAGVGMSTAGTFGDELHDGIMGALAGAGSAAVLPAAAAGLRRVGEGSIGRSAQRALASETPIRDAVRKAGADVKKGALSTIGHAVTGELLGGMGGHAMTGLSVAKNVGMPVARAAGVAADEGLAAIAARALGLRPPAPAAAPTGLGALHLVPPEPAPPVAAPAPAAPPAVDEAATAARFGMSPETLRAFQARGFKAPAEAAPSAPTVPLRGADETIAKFTEAARGGNKFAQRMLANIQKSPAHAARAAATMDIAARLAAALEHE